MTRDDILRMAMEANILAPVDLLETNQWREDTIRELERFAVLVAAAALAEPDDSLTAAYMLGRCDAKQTLSRSKRLAEGGFTRRPSLWALDAREALELIAAPMRPDGTWNRDREACRRLAAEVLGRPDPEY